MILINHRLSLLSSNKFKRICKRLFYSFLPSVFLVLTSTLVSGVYPAYAFDRSIFQIVITPDGFPIIWRKSFAEDIETQLDSQQLLALSICNASADCLQSAVDSGAVYFKEFSNIHGDFIAYYDENGKLVGTSLKGEASSVDPVPSSTTGTSSNMVSDVVGSLPGEFAVTPAGSANYTIPIEIPPSTNGVAPELAFSYDSQSGNGFMGVGWAIAGIPEITRCGANLAIDGYIRPVALTYEDKFCMGGQRLIAVSGAYGAFAKPKYVVFVRVDSFPCRHGFGLGRVAVGRSLRYHVLPLLVDTLY